jgi:hypothetical protein
MFLVCNTNFLRVIFRVEIFDIHLLALFWHSGTIRNVKPHVTLAPVLYSEEESTNLYFLMSTSVRPRHDRVIVIIKCKILCKSYVNSLIDESF